MSTYVGVCYKQKPRKWIATVQTDVNGASKGVYLGQFQDEGSAVQARDKALYVLRREDEMQVGLTSQEKQQLQGVSLDQFLAARKAASFSFSTGRSAYRGVTFHTASRKWQSQLQLHGKNNFLGKFSCEEDAADAYDKAAVAALGSKAHLNFPEKYSAGLQAAVVPALTCPTPATLSAEAKLDSEAPCAAITEVSTTSSGAQEGTAELLCDADAQGGATELLSATEAAQIAVPAATSAADVHKAVDSKDPEVQQDEAEDQSSVFSDDMSSWGSGEEIWGYETEYYDTEEEEEATAELRNHPDYQYLLKHGGEPCLSLFGGPDADVSPANLLDHFMHKWAQEAAAAQPADSPGVSPSCNSTGTSLQSCQLGLQEALLSLFPDPDSTVGCAVGTRRSAATAADSVDTSGPQQGACVQNRSFASAPGPSATAPGPSAMAQGGLSLHTSFVDSSSPAHRGSKLAPSEDAVRMANIGATAVPGMTPAEYRQALYHTWMTGEPAGMQYIDFDSDVEAEDQNEGAACETEEEEEGGIHVAAEKQQLSNKRVKLTAAVADLGQQVKLLQDSLNPANTDNVSSELSSIPWWAQEMGMTEAEYWSGLHDCSQRAEDASLDSRITPVEVTQEDLVFIASKRCTPDMSAIQL